MALLLSRDVGSGYLLGVGGHSYVVCHEVPLVPSAAQRVLLLGQCAHGRYVWNLGLEQPLMWARWKGPTPGFNEHAAQLNTARRAVPWLVGGSQTVQQQALRDLDQAWQRFFNGTHRRPSWCKAGQHEGLRIVGPQGLRVRQEGRARSSVLVPKIGWVQFKRSRALTDCKSYRITGDRSGRWHIAFAVTPARSLFLKLAGLSAWTGVSRLRWGCPQVR